jgi:hypothetical protein
MIGIKHVVALAAEQAARAAPSDRRQPAYQRLMNRLEAPEVIAIDRNGNSVTMASSRGQRVTFRFDGVIENIRTPAGETIGVDSESTVEGKDSQTE